MITKSLLSLAAALLVGIVQGVTISWTIPHAHPSYTWQSEITGMAILTSGSNKITTEQGVIDGYHNGTVTTVGTSKTIMMAESEDAIDLTGVELKENHYYFLALKKSPTEYVIYNAHQYLPKLDPETNRYSDKEHGFYYDKVGNTVRPDEAAYVDIPGILGGTWKAATTPEPTALALFALGVAGLALRRKNTNL